MCVMDGVESSGRLCFRRIIWAIVLIIGVILAVYHIRIRVKYFENNPFATKIEFEHLKEAVFPAVAICNRNSIRNTALLNLTREIREKLENETRENLFNIIDVEVLSTMEDFFDQKGSVGGDETFFEWHMKAMHQKNDLILNCRGPDGKRCQDKDFKTLFLDRGGQSCQVYNWDKKNPMKAAGYGPEHGLSLILNTENYERIIPKCVTFFEAQAQTAGLTVEVFDQSEYPALEINGLNIDPGSKIKLAVSKIKRSHVKEKDGCVDEHDLKYLSSETYKNSRGCVLDNNVRYMLSRCGCVPHFSPRDDGVPLGSEEGIKKLKQVRQCTIKDYFTCVAKPYPQFQCADSCQTIKYNPSVIIRELSELLMPESAATVTQGDFGQFLPKVELLGQITGEKDIFAEFREGLMDLEDQDEDNLVKDQSCQKSLLTTEKVDTIKADLIFSWEEWWKNHRQSREKLKIRVDRYLETIEGLETTGILKFTADYHPSVFKWFTEKSKCYHDILIDDESNFPQLLKEKTRFVEELLDERVIEKHLKEKISPSYATAVGQFYLQTFSPAFVPILVTLNQRSFPIFEQEEPDLGAFTRQKEMALKYRDDQITMTEWAEEAMGLYHESEEELDKLIQTIQLPLTDTLYKVRKFPDTQISLEGILSDETAREFSQILFNMDNQTEFDEFTDQLRAGMDCANKELEPLIEEYLKEIMSALHNYTQAYRTLFNKHLDYHHKKVQIGPQFARDNIIELDIYFQDLAVEHQIQEINYSLTGLLCDIGGLLGLILFIGACIIFLLELFFLCCDIFSGKNKKRGKEEDGKDNPMSEFGTFSLVLHN